MTEEAVEEFIRSFDHAVGRGKGDRKKSGGRRNKWKDQQKSRDKARARDRAHKGSEDAFEDSRKRIEQDQIEIAAARALEAAKERVEDAIAALDDAEESVRTFRMALPTECGAALTYLAKTYTELDTALAAVSIETIGDFTPEVEALTDRVEAFIEEVEDAIEAGGGVAEIDRIFDQAVKVKSKYPKWKALGDAMAQVSASLATPPIDASSFGPACTAVSDLLDEFSLLEGDYATLIAQFQAKAAIVGRLRTDCKKYLDGEDFGGTVLDAYTKLHVLAPDVVPNKVLDGRDLDPIRSLVASFCLWVDTVDAILTDDRHTLLCEAMHIGFGKKVDPPKDFIFTESDGKRFCKTLFSDLSVNEAVAAAAFKKILAKEGPWSKRERQAAEAALRAGYKDNLRDCIVRVWSLGAPAAASLAAAVNPRDDKLEKLIEGGLTQAAFDGYRTKFGDVPKACKLILQNGAVASINTIGTDVLPHSEVSVANLTTLLSSNSIVCRFGRKFPYRNRTTGVRTIEVEISVAWFDSKVPIPGGFGYVHIHYSGVNAVQADATLMHLKTPATSTSGGSGPLMRITNAATAGYMHGLVPAGTTL
ncbi:MAG: hypothetical protein AAFO97_13475 [Pseudomonadota bacterium]